MKNAFYVGLFFSVMAFGAADALQYNTGRSAFKFNASGTAGIIEPDFKNVLFLGDFELRAQYNYAIARGQTLGFVYEWDANALSENEYAHEAFALWENQNLGRIEVGFTESVAHKLGVGMPDVGELKLNHNPIFYNRMKPHGAIIPDISVTTGHDSPRVNLVTVPTNVGQYGISVAAFGDDFDYAVDGGVKFRFPNGKLKTALSLGASFMDKPHNYNPVSYVPDVNADWRAQGSIGFNLQYNSWIWGTSVVAIYDENPVGITGDGISAGTGISYDVLNYSVSLSYMYSQTGIWHDDVRDYDNHTVVYSARYKYDEYLSLWASIGWSTETPFLSTAVKISF